MLSILIPTYNYDITQLVEELNRQATEILIDFEIIVIEDGSTLFLETNKSVSTYKNCTYIVLSENIGRAAIRNRLADMAKFDSLIFMDCDAEVMNDFYIKKYVSFIKDNSVIVGGTAYDLENKNPEYSLRLRYGIKREATVADIRSKKSRYSHFSTFNFMISKSTFHKIRFDETIRGYGHEDTLFGFHLAESNCEIIHINNPLLHKGLDNNKDFLTKTKEATRNLYFLYQSNHYPFLKKQSKLLLTFEQLEAKNLVNLFSKAFNLFEPVMRYNLTSRFPSLRIYDLYKLLYLCNTASNI